MSGVGDAVWRERRSFSVDARGNADPEGFDYHEERHALEFDALGANPYHMDPGRWLPLSARAGLREQIVALMGNQVWLGPQDADAVLALIFGAEPDGGGS